MTLTLIGSVKLTERVRGDIRWSGENSVHVRCEGSPREGLAFLMVMSNAGVKVAATVVPKRLAAAGGRTLYSAIAPGAISAMTSANSMKGRFRV